MKLNCKNCGHQLILGDVTIVGNGANKTVMADNTRAADPRIAELEAENARLRKDADRYKALEAMAYLDDPYDHGASTSSWDWTIRLETGKSKGRNPPPDTPTFQETLDAAIKESER